MKPAWQCRAVASRRPVWDNDGNIRQELQLLADSRTAGIPSLKTLLEPDDAAPPEGCHRQNGRERRCQQRKLV